MLQHSNPSRPFRFFGALAASLAATAFGGCSTADSATGRETEATSTGGSSAASGTGGATGSGTGGVTASGLVTGSGGAKATGGAAPVTGGTSATGGVSTGGTVSVTGGTSTGGTSGGSKATGGAGNGGSISPTGGTSGAAGASGGSAGSGGGAAGAPNNCPKATPLTGGQQYCKNQTGDAGGKYSYELWAEGSGTGCMTVHGKDATFSATWNNVEDLLARVGLQFDRTRKHAQIGKISAEFAETKTGSDGLVYVGIYGWTVDPLREYYILDDWGAIKPAGTASDGTPRDFVGEFTVDGETYDVWKKTRVDKPAITGDSETFDQYFSIRRTARQCGHISISEHFSNWEELGLPLGNLTEAKLLVEAQDSSGTIAFTTATFAVE